MPVFGKPAPFHVTLLIPRPNRAVRKAVMALADRFPKPHNYITSLGFNLRKRRLGVELAEFDFLHRINRGGPAGADLLCRVGEVLIEPCQDHFPTCALPVYEPLFVTPESFERLVRAAESDPSFNQRRDIP